MCVHILFGFTDNNTSSMTSYSTGILCALIRSLVTSSN